MSTSEGKSTQPNAAADVFGRQIELLRLATAGSVDDGKSTLLGRLLVDTKAVFEDQLQAVEDANVRKGGATKLATAVENCRVVLFNRCGHWVMVEESDRFNRLVLDFLNHG